MKLDDCVEDLPDGENGRQALLRLQNAAHEREREIEEIANSISDLSHVFKDLSTMVITQGTLVDRIDYNIDQTFLSVREGFSELKSAEQSQSRSS